MQFNDLRHPCGIYAGAVSPGQWIAHVSQGPQSIRPSGTIAPHGQASHGVGLGFPAAVRHYPARLLMNALMQASRGSGPLPETQLVRPEIFSGILTCTT